MISEHPQPEWLDLKALQRYACVSERTLREWVHRPIDALPAARVGVKILVRRSTFDHWLENHKLKVVDVGCIVDEMVAGLTGSN
ncbi:MAG: DNA-binding protein [Candidatus Sulfotelmatobacter sp.]|nr:DNA-binding protein [Candidatus Sulfotelmatobacter sp.]